MQVVARAVAGIVEGPDAEILILLPDLVIAGEETLVVRINDVGIARIGDDETALTATGVRPIALLDDATVGPARDAHVRVVLLRAVDVIGEGVVDRDVIELRRRLIALRRPSLAAVHRDARTAVIGVAEACGIFWINPEPVMITVPAGEKRECLAAVHGAKRARVQNVNRVGRFRVRVNLAEIPGALAEAAVVVHARPFSATIFGTEEPAFFRFDRCVNAIRIRPGNREADASENSVGQSISLQLLPGHAAIFGAIQSAPRSAAGKIPGLPARLPHGREDDVRIVRVRRQINRARVLVLVENLGPRLAAIGGAKNSPLLIRSEGMTKGRDQNDVGIFRIDDHRADLPGVFQADVLPGLARVQRLIHAGAVGDIAAHRVFARADVNDVVIGRRHCDRADG